MTFPTTVLAEVRRLVERPRLRNWLGFSEMVDDVVIDQLRAAAEALNEGDPVPFASMFARDAEWRGVSSGRLWWKHTPS